METKLARRPQLWVQENHPPHGKLFTQPLAPANRSLALRVDVDLN
jgi:hypothetical protein